MTSLRLPGHLFTLLVLLYLAADFMDPFTPGVFSFEKDTFFVDGAVQPKSDASKDLTPTAPMMPSGGPADCDDENAAAKVRIVSRPLRPQHALWKNLKHDDSASFASSSPPDSSPTPLQS